MFSSAARVNLPQHTRTYMNSHVRAVRAGVSLYKTAVLFTVRRVLRRAVRREKKRSGESALAPRAVAQVPVLRQADTYLSKCLHAQRSSYYGNI